LIFTDYKLYFKALLIAGLLLQGARDKRGKKQEFQPNLKLF
jgi:hypothetical protein